MTTTLADHLRSLPDDALAALLRMRPDLVVPVPTDVSALAVRAQSRMSVARALDGLDEFTLRILDAARLTRDPQTGLTSVDAMLGYAGPPPRGGDPATIRPAIDRLRALFLLYGPEHALQVAAGVDEVCSAYPAGLGRPAAELDPAAAELCADPARLRRTLLAAPPPARAVLDRLAAGPPVGTVPPAGSNGAAPAVRWLVENHLLVPVPPAGGGLPAPTSPVDGGSPPAAAGTVELPREVGLLLRRDTGPLGALRPTPPAPTAPEREPKAADSAGAGQAMEVVRHTEALLEALSADPPPLLRTGGLGVRESRRLARAVGLDEETLALLLEVAYAADLAGEDEVPGTARQGGSDLQLLPTAGYELWRTGSLAQRWVRLAQAWLMMPRQPGLIGQRDDRDRVITALSTEVQRAGAPAARLAVLALLAGLDPGAAPAPDEVLALLAWHTPRRSRGREPAHREALAEAARLGVTGLGALTGYGRLLLAEQTADQTSGPADPLGVRTGGGRDGGVRASGGRDVAGGARDGGVLGTADPESAANWVPGSTGGGAAARTLAGLLPAPVDHFLVQADLTVVVPGPPEAGLAEELELVAEQESAGGASVHRVTGASVRRALDNGYHAEDLHALFRQRSRTPVPQSLTYLIDDTARRHGGLRAGAAGAYLRSEDTALLAEVLADRRLGTLDLRRLAPTVLITPLKVPRMLAALREAGYAPVAEDASGALVLARPKVRRAPVRSATGRADGLSAPKLSRPRLLGVVEQIRRGEAAARAARRAPGAVRAGNGPARTETHAHTQALAVLQQAVRDRTLVWVGYVDAHGATASRLVRPVSIGGGYLRAEDERTEMLHTFALHRITAAVLDD
ncbi:helicase-associated domain-containing protein [Solwaraspora sp. WMMD1047]|uniref:helicase-associated domain-containing protein n=1 Tax=Solwaraspora sp. WMMD1047 TaxID=3016102 RepID=UPI002416C668|nr:helicase-associated domain-containing protein [Solwaraspora sp. WMMD1047]MDG4833805.1 helicase-associated domain-containing protein [Solwaraspora sp. WMMD1047]